MIKIVLDNLVVLFFWGVGKVTHVLHFLIEEIKQKMWIYYVKIFELRSGFSLLVLYFRYLFFISTTCSLFQLLVLYFQS